MFVNQVGMHLLARRIDSESQIKLNLEIIEDNVVGRCHMTGCEMQGDSLAESFPQSLVHICATSLQNEFQFRGNSICNQCKNV